MGKIVLYDLLMIMTGGKNDKNKTPYTLINIGIVKKDQQTFLQLL